MILNRERKIVLIIGLLVILAALATLVWYLPRIGKVEIHVIVAPEDSKLTINDKEFKPGKILIEPGQHTLKASRDLFLDAQRTIDTNSLKPQEIIYLSPAPTDAAFDWLLKNPEAQAKREQVGSAQADARKAQLEATFPIITKLPYETIEFRIDYFVGQVDNIEFTITLYPIGTPADRPNSYFAELQEYRNKAFEFLRQNNIDPTQYKVTITPNPETQ